MVRDFGNQFVAVIPIITAYMVDENGDPAGLLFAHFSRVDPCLNTTLSCEKFQKKVHEKVGFPNTDDSRFGRAKQGSVDTSNRPLADVLFTGKFAEKYQCKKDIHRPPADALFAAFSVGQNGCKKGIRWRGASRVWSVTNAVFFPCSNASHGRLQTCLFRVLFHNFIHEKVV